MGQDVHVVAGGKMTMPDGPAAFMSYVRFDDQHDDGKLSQFRERLGAEVRAQTGREFAIFQDRNDIAWGQNWQQRIDETLDAVTLLLVIITPSLFRSPPCRAELARFLDRERALGREDLILPVYYISAREMDNPALREGDAMAEVLASRQFADWRELRFEPFTSPLVLKATALLATRMRDTFWLPPAAPAARRSDGRRARAG
jgi:F-box protein 11